MTPKWIFFDLDDTLFDFSSASLISLRRIWDERKEINSAYDSPESFIDEYHIHNTRMWQLHEQGEITADFLKRERFRLTVYPGRHDEEALRTSRELNDRYLWLLGECNSVCAGAKELLEYLSGRCLIGVLTNGFTEVQYRKLKTTGLERFIQRVVISDEIGVQKPDPQIFRHAENATGAIPESTVMIGDNPVNDIAGALNAGWKAIYYDRKGKEFNSHDTLYLGRVHDLLEIQNLLRHDCQ